MSRNELVEAIDFGSDIMFDCCDKSFSILGWYEAGPLIAEQSNGNNRQVFKDGADLVDNYKIDGKPLSDHLSNIEITYQT